VIRIWFQAVSTEPMPSLPQFVPTKETGEGGLPRGVKCGGCWLLEKVVGVSDHHLQSTTDSHSLAPSLQPDIISLLSRGWGQLAYTNLYVLLPCFTSFDSRPVNFGYLPKGKVTHIRNFGNQRRFHASVRVNLFCLHFMGLSSARYSKSSKSIVSFGIQATGDVFVCS
jgi:hypothetical protein